jgi:hypothetical protein
MKTVDKFNNIVTLSPGQYPRSEEKPSQDVLSMYSGSVEKIAFPILGIVLLMLVCLGWILPYPQLLQARATIVQLADSVPGITLVVDLPADGGPRPDSGQEVEIFFDRLGTEQVAAQQGTIVAVSAPDSNHNVAIQVLLVRRPDIDIPAVAKRGEKAELLITLKRMRLFQRFFHNYHRFEGKAGRTG